ncbi:MAG: oligosaccharide flippase family protein [Chitinophagaceae bacterium]
MKAKNKLYIKGFVQQLFNGFGYHIKRIYKSVDIINAISKIINVVIARLFNIKIGKRFISTIILDIAGKGIPYLLLPVYLSLMSQDEFGLYTYLTNIILSASVILKLGMDTAETKLFYENFGESRGKMLFTINSFVIGVFLLYFFLALIFSLNKSLLGLVITNVIISNEMVLAYWVNLFLGVVIVFLNVYYVIAERFLLYQKYNLFRLIVANGLACTFLYYNNSSAIVRLTVEGVVGVIILLPLVYFYIKDFRIGFDKTIFRQSLRIGIPILMTNVLAITSGFADKYLIQDKKSINDLAIYNLALFLAMPISLIFSSFHSLWVPKLFKQEDIFSKLRSTQSIFKRLLLIFLTCIFFIWIGILLALQTNLITVNYDFLRYVFPVVALAFAMECLSQLYNNIVVVINKTEITFFINLLLMFFLILLNLWLLPLYGILATSIIYLGVTVVRVFAFKHIIKWKISL